MRHLLINALCVAVIGLAMIYSADRVATSTYSNVYAIVSKGSLSMVKNSVINAKVLAKQSD